MADPIVVAEPFQLDGIEVIPDELTIWRQGQRHTLEPRAMSLLMVLVEEPGRVFTRNELYDALWGQAEVSDQALTNAVWELRQALGDSPKRSRFVRTIPRRGYQLTVNPAPLKRDPKQLVRKNRWPLYASLVALAVSALVAVLWLNLSLQTAAPQLPSETGLEAWTFTTGGEIHADPLPIGDDLLVASHDGFIYLLGLFGAERWRAQISTRVALMPSTDGQRIYVTAEDGYLYAFDRSNGRELWRRNINAKSAPAAVTDGVLVAGFDRNLWYLSAESGEPEAIIRGIGDVVLSPMVAAHTAILIEENGRASAVDLQERRFRWRKQLEGVVAEAPSLGDQRLYVGTAGGYVYALGIDEGEEFWRARVAERNAGGTEIDLQSGQVYVSTEQGNLVALELETGNRIWEISGGSFFSPPGHAYGVVFAGNGDGLLYAISSQDGRLLWHVDLGSWLLTRAVVVSGQILIGDVSGRLHSVPVSGHHPPARHSDPLDIPTPEVLWTLDLGDPATIAATHHQGMLLVAAGSTLNAVDFLTGTLLWRYPALGEIHSQPAVGGGRAWFSTRAGLLLGVSLDNGAEAIEVRLPAGSISGPLWLGDGLVVGDHDGNIHRFDADGTLRWTTRTSITVNADPMLVDGMVVVGSCDGYVYALSPDSGEILWRMLAGECVVADTVAGEQWLYTGTSDGYFLSFDRDGNERWRFRTDGEIWYQPAVADGLVVFGSRDYRIYALEEDSGEERWRFRTENRAVSDVVYLNDHFIAGSYDGCVYALTAQSGAPTWRFCSERELVNPMIVADTVIVGGENGILYALQPW